MVDLVAMIGFFSSSTNCLTVVGKQLNGAFMPTTGKECGLNVTRNKIFKNRVWNTNYSLINGI